MPFLFQLILGIGLMILSAMLRPKPRQHLDNVDIKQPTASAGRPIPVVFGSVQITDGNYLYFGQVAHVRRPMHQKGKK